MTVTAVLGRRLMVLEYVRHYYSAHGIPPTTRELVEEGLASSTSVASYALEKLADAGHLRRVRRNENTYYVPLADGLGGCALCGCKGHKERG